MLKAKDNQTKKRRLKNIKTRQNRGILYKRNKEIEVENLD